MGRIIKILLIVVFAVFSYGLYLYMPLSRSIPVNSPNTRTYNNDVKIASTKDASMMEIETLGEGSQQDSLKVITFNIHYGKISNLDAIGDFLKSIGADIIALQEVDKNQRRSNNFNQGEYLAKYLDMSYIYGPNIKLGNSQYGNAILSKFPILEANNHTLPSALEPRGILEARINVNGELITILNTHLAISDRERIGQVDSILRIIGDRRKNIILLGDFNEIPEGDNIIRIKETFKDLWETYGETEGFTFPNWNPGVRIDYIFIGNGFAIEEVYISTEALSDHLPVISKLKFVKEGVLDEERPIEEGSN